MFFFEKQPCVHLSFRSSGVCLGSNNMHFCKDWMKWITDARQEGKEYCLFACFQSTTLRCNLLKPSSVKYTPVHRTDFREAGWSNTVMCYHCSYGGTWMYHPSFIWMSWKCSVTLGKRIKEIS